MELEQTDKAESKRGAEPARTRNAAKKPDEAKKKAGQIDPERLISRRSDTSMSTPSANLRLRIPDIRMRCSGRW
jgi:hypothetical protein